jgi:hypothetical protein
MTRCVQVFVPRAALLQDGPITVLAAYDPPQDLALDAHGDHATALVLPVDAVSGHLLTRNWRDYVSTAIKAEASRRILAVMPQYKQLDFVAESVVALLTLGADMDRWPADARARVRHGIALWRYAEAVRARSDQLEDVPPADPTDDAHWPEPPFRCETGAVEPPPFDGSGLA